MSSNKSSKVKKMYVDSDTEEEETIYETEEEDEQNDSNDTDEIINEFIRGKVKNHGNKKIDKKIDKKTDKKSKHENNKKANINKNSKNNKVSEKSNSTSESSSKERSYHLRSRKVKKAESPKSKSKDMKKKSKKIESETEEDDDESEIDLDSDLDEEFDSDEEDEDDDENESEEDEEIDSDDEEDDEELDSEESEDEELDSDESDDEEEEIVVKGKKYISKPTKQNKKEEAKSKETEKDKKKTKEIEKSKSKSKETEKAKSKSKETEKAKSKEKSKEKETKAKGKDKGKESYIVMNMNDLIDSIYDDEDEDYEDEFAEDYETDSAEEVDSEDEKTFMKEKFASEPNPKKSETSKKTDKKPDPKAEKQKEDDLHKKATEKMDKKYETLDDMRQFLTQRLEKDPKNKILKHALQDIKENIHKLVKQARSKNARKFHEMVSEKTNGTNKMNDMEYFKKKLSNKEQIRAMEDLKEINEHIYLDKPYRMAILEMDIPYKYKAIALSRLDTMKQMEQSMETGGYTKMKEWIDTFMRIPFAKYRNLPVQISDGPQRCFEFMNNAKQILDDCTYGLNDAKMQIMQVLGNWISNPTSMGTAIAIRGPPGTGKCMVRDTPILMYDGSIKMVQDVVVGDLLMGDDSKPRKVSSLGRGQDDLYDVVPVKGESYGVNSEHILCLKPSGMHRLKTLKKTRESGDEDVVEIGDEDVVEIGHEDVAEGGDEDVAAYKVEYFDTQTFHIKSKRFQDKKLAMEFLDEKAKEHQIAEIPVKTLLGLSKYIQEHLKGYSVGAEFASKPVPFDPYILGVWLGDGESACSRITNQDAKILHYLREKLSEYHLSLNYVSDYQYSISYDLHRQKKDTRNNKNVFLQVLKDYNMINNKHIPDLYKINDRNVQLQMLAGIIDTDGYYSVKSKYYEITQKNKRLSDDILFISRSLGFTAYQKEYKKSCMYKGEKREGTYFTVTISGSNIHEIPVKIERKKVTEGRLQKKDSTVTGIKIVPRGYGDYYGFELDGNHRYLLGSFTVTHNTTIVRDGISKILGREFAFITLGGATDSAFFDGFSYTYEGSKWGKIVQILLDSKSMNPVIYFDELDKISTTDRGQEITGLLTHLTDTSQNNQFHDKYFSEIDFDLSRCLFIFSYNDEALVNPILKDRMYIVETKGYSAKEKVIIAQKHLLPKIRQQVFFREDEVIVPNETIQYLVEKEELTAKEEGVRNLKRCLEIVFKKLNLLRLMGSGNSGTETKSETMQIFGEEFKFKVEFPFTVKKEHIDALIKKRDVGATAWKDMFI
jgi:ATP-dependent Lon protease